MNNSIFVVEDDESIRELVVYALAAAGFEAVGFDGGEAFLAQVTRSTASDSLPKLILLDIMMPVYDGLHVLKVLRNNQAYKDVPIIMLTAKSGEVNVAKALDMGADDYITKPFGVTELVSRVKAVLRRSAQNTQSAPSDSFICGNLEVDKRKRAVYIDGKAVLLTFKEYELLHYLLVNEGIVMSRDKIMEAVWGYDFEGETRTVDVHINTLRQKLGSAGKLVRTVRNVGYIIEG